MKLTSDLLSLSPLGHSDGFASCKAWRVLISASLPKTPFPRERLCMLGWLCIVQSPCAYTPGIRAGAILLGLPPLVQARMLAVSHTKPLHDAVAQMADDLYGGYAPATPFLSTIEVFRQSAAVHRLDARLLCYWLFFSKVGVPFA